jgi:3-hydroxybutyrate dehydrogenase
MPRPVAFVTGAGRGIGRATARRFARAGYALGLTGRSHPHLLEAIDEITDAGGTARAVVCDVTNRKSIERAVEKIQRELGEIDVLVNNAGIADSAPFVSITDESWDRILAVNLTGTYLCMRVIVPGMFERRRGRVINIASIAGLTGFAYTAAYCAAKHGVVGLTRAVAIEAASKGVTVNAVCPGWVNTDMTRASIARIVTTTGRTEEQARAVLERMSPQGRLIEPDEVAAVVVFLASPDAHGINGQTLSVDGGELTA